MAPPAHNERALMSVGRRPVWCPVAIHASRRALVMSLASKGTRLRL
jgi:hypothetical protein